MENQQEKKLLPTWCYCYGEWQCDNNLSSSAFRLLTIINSISNNGKGSCFVSNERLSKITGTSVRQVQNMLKELKRLNYIDIFYTTNFRNNASVRNIIVKAHLSTKRAVEDENKNDDENNKFGNNNLFEWNWLEECE